MELLLGFAFLAGIVTILSPCVLPILPIVLSGSVGGGKRRPLGIIFGFVISFTIFTLFLTAIVKLLGIPSDTLRIVADTVLLVFGFTLLAPKFQTLMEKLFTKLSVFSPTANPNTGFFGGFVIGLSIGLIWSPCVGPILASVIALAATSKVNSQTFLITLVYAIGSGIPMLLIMHGGRGLLNKVRVLTKNTGVIQKAFGILMIIMAIVIFANWDRKFEQYIATTSYGANLTKLEENDVVKNQLNLLKGSTEQNSLDQDESGLFNSNTPAPDFVGINKWLNIDPSLFGSAKFLNVKNLRGKVVLIDFWTYTCINCIRTLPHVTSWYDKYKDQGFVVVGVHTPEFAFEHDTSNVLSAIKQYNIHYPVAQDNDYATWNNYSNQYWPAEYLIDSKGIIRRTHFGEGEYDQMEAAIQALLKEAGKKVTSKLENMPDQTPTDQSISPETYLGSQKMQYYYPSGTLNNGKQTYELSDNLADNSFSLGGDWDIEDEYSVALKNATLNYSFTADKVHLVMRPPGSSGSCTPNGICKEGEVGKVRVYLDGKQVDEKTAGSDVKDATVNVDSDRLYNLIDLHGKVESHVLRLEFVTPGIEVFAFTFG